jgi:hypothetical protein
MSLVKQRLFGFLSALLLAGLALPWPKSSALGSSDALLIVTGRSFPADDITYAALKRAFRGQRVQLAGKPLNPINHPRDTQHRIAFDRTVLGLGPESVGRFWVDMRIRDQAIPPTTASTPQIAIRMAAVLPGAVTYAPEIAVLPSLKVLTVDGKRASDYGYPIRP